MLFVKFVMVLLFVIALSECRASRLDFNSPGSGWPSRSASNGWDSNPGRSRAWGASYESGSPGLNARSSFSGCPGARSSNGWGNTDSARYDQNAW